MIFRGKTISSSDDDAKHRVKVSIPSVWEDKNQIPFIETLNGMFLRKGEHVYVWMNDSYDAAVVLGRQGNWFDANEFVDLMNSLIDHMNEMSKEIRDLKKALNSHTHGGVYTGGMTSLPYMTTPGNEILTPTLMEPMDIKNIDVDTIISPSDSTRKGVVKVIKTL